MGGAVVYEFILKVIKNRPTNYDEVDDEDDDEGSTREAHTFEFIDRDDSELCPWYIRTCGQP